MKKAFSILAALLVTLNVFAAFNPEYSDYQFYNLQDFDTDMAYLEDALASASSDEEKAAILWRQARQTPGMSWVCCTTSFPVSAAAATTTTPSAT